MSRFAYGISPARGKVSLPDKEFRLMSYSTLSLSGRREHVAPACRHADGTISSSGAPDVRRMVSEGSRHSFVWPSLLIACTYAFSPVYHNIYTSLVAQDTQVSQHMAGCLPHRHRCGGQRIYLRTVIVTAAVHRAFTLGPCLSAK